MQIKSTINKRMFCWRNKILIIIFFIVFICLYLISRHWKIKVAEIVLFETFSTSIEVFVALVALLGMVGVFKLELLNGKKDRLAEAAQELIIYFRGDRKRNLLPQELLKEGKNIIKQDNLPKGSEVNRLKRVISNLEKTFNTANSIKVYILDFIIFTSIMIIISLIFLIFTLRISGFYFGIPTLFTILVLSVISLLSMIGLVQSIL